MANKMQQKAMHYGLTINNVVENTEKYQEELDPLFTALKDKLTANDLASMTPADYDETRATFAKRTADYATLADKLAAAVPPARLMGNQQLLVAAYRDFVAGCQAMTDSLGPDKKVDEAQFSAAEQQQDAATEKISKYLQRITNLV